MMYQTVFIMVIAIYYSFVFCCFVCCLVLWFGPCLLCIELHVLLGMFVVLPFLFGLFCYNTYNQSHKLWRTPSLAPSPVSMLKWYVFVS